MTHDDILNLAYFVKQARKASKMARQWKENDFARGLYRGQRIAFLSAARMVKGYATQAHLVNLRRRAA